MDDALRQQIAAWLEYYRDLGIEDFYRRAPGERAEIQNRIVETRNSKLEIQRASDSGKVPKALPDSRKSRPLNPEPRVPSPESRSPIVPPPLSMSLFEAPPPVRGPETLEQIRADLGDCHRCKLAGGRKTIVFGQGNPHAELVFVGEGPGADEDEQGLPFVGRAGQLLNRMIQFVGMKREEVYICNIVKCRPPGNRTPEKDEVDACSPFLFRQLEAIKPRLICCLGAPAMKTLLGIKEGITRVRGQFFDYAGTKAFVAYHPAYILRNPREEKILRADFETIRDFLKSSR
ncbi:MAG: uracil-DNA glycosylase [Terriglobia bacterium]